MFTIIFVAKSLKGFGWNNVGPALQTMAQHYFIIDPMYRVIRIMAFRVRKVTRMAVRANRGNHPILFQCWASVEYDWPALNQQWAATLAQQWTGIEWVHCVAWMLTSKHKTLYYLCTTLYKCYTNVLCLLGWPAPAMVVEGIGSRVEDILVSLVISIIISWTFRILAHEEDQYTVMFTIY